MIVTNTHLSIITMKKLPIIVLSLGLITSCFSDGLSTLKFANRFKLFGGGGIVFSNNIQDVKVAVANGQTYPYDQILVAGDPNGGGNVGVEFDITRYLGVDFNYTNRGKQNFGITYQTELGVDAIGATLKSQSYAIEGLLLLPLKQLTPYMKLGYARYNMTWFHYSGVPGVPINQEATVPVNGNGFTYGVGCRFPLPIRALEVSPFVDGINMYNNTPTSSSVSQYYAGINVLYTFA